MQFNSFAYLCPFFEERRKEKFKNNPAGGWYFIFEFTTSLLLGVIPSVVINIFLFPDFWLERDRIPLAIVLTFAIVSTLLVVGWVRFGGFTLPLRFNTFVPFIRENLGKKSHPEINEDRTEKVRLSPLFMGCGVSFISAFSIIIGLLLIWSRS
ncbi:hypothetical protein CMUST_10380 [Corynebacterium mustelae]|uniref:Uncharacterized protein n=1 Tax=Corynebacterium mustelae TaxID=571915 RepID=A0A0G3H5H1_9CORY|nr:hypothetical protein [Corynebacterium mustelae]AKK06392.1 hypothetical protein CMUST_10380 [Corynebacterium mustelae]